MLTSQLHFPKQLSEERLLISSCSTHSFLLLKHRLWAVQKWSLRTLLDSTDDDLSTGILLYIVRAVFTKTLSDTADNIIHVFVD